MRLNGWQRLWVLFSIPFVLFGLWLLYVGIKNENRIDFWASLWLGLGGPLLLYVAGWAVAWVRRGFKQG